MSIVDQAEIDALLAEASDLVAEANTAAQDPPPPPPPPPRPRPLPNDPALARVLRVRVPVIVQLAQRIMPIATVRNLSVGSIIEFEKSVEHPLELLINNRPIGQGTCVKVGENFGLRITSIVDKAQRIRSLV
jgi:flagellar motor switch protein FliN/FliY